MSPTFLSVVIPSYNEGSRIQSTLDRVVQYLSANFSRFEVIVVDDGSTDDTREKIASIAGKDSRITSLSFPNNHGKGLAVRQGILKAKGGVSLFLDADLSTPIEETDKALEGWAKGYPVVIASRQHPESVIHLHQGWFRERIGQLFNLFVRMLLPLRYRDTHCGFKCFSRNAAREIFLRAGTDGFTFDVEVLLIAKRLGYPVKEIPICWTNFPVSKVRPVQDSFRIMKELFTIYWNDRKGLYG